MTHLQWYVFMYSLIFPLLLFYRCIAKRVFGRGDGLFIGLVEVKYLLLTFSDKIEWYTIITRGEEFVCRCLSCV